MVRSSVRLPILGGWRTLYLEGVDSESVYYPVHTVICVFYRFHSFEYMLLQTVHLCCLPHLCKSVINWLYGTAATNSTIPESKLTCDTETRASYLF